jgi:IS66 Orf2 like protein
MLPQDGPLCPITQAGFVRVVSNPAFSMLTITPREALANLAITMKHYGHHFGRDDISLVQATEPFAARMVGGLCLFAKRLERGRFVWPQATSGTVCLTRAQLSMLLEGIEKRLLVLCHQFLCCSPKIRLPPLALCSRQRGLGTSVDEAQGAWWF